MGVLRFLLTVTWAAWIWLELVAVAGPVAVAHLRGRGRPREGRGVALLLACAGVSFVVAVRIARLPEGALPGPPGALLAAGLAVMWAGLALRAWSVYRLATAGSDRSLRRASTAGALTAAFGFGVALVHLTSLLVLVAGWSLGIAARSRVEGTSSG
jgi:hypothetical protein